MENKYLVVDLGDDIEVTFYFKDGEVRIENNDPMLDNIDTICLTREQSILLANKIIEFKK